MVCSYLQYWTDQKGGVTGRARALNQSHRDKSRGPPTELLSQYDQRVLRCMGGWSQVVGIPSTKDPLEVILIGRHMEQYLLHIVLSYVLMASDGF